ncbi:MAG TPA: thioredoxin family protein [Verrucomicrobiae bacterium]|jgi:thioredoxin-related protein|nr:thioredoxin family protein [Verrucomicrobiae bacterium]
MQKIFQFLFLAAVVTTLRAEPKWLTKLDEAKAQAQKEDKAVLLDFTGSDWCPPCMKLKKTVFNSSEFEKFAEKHLVLVEVDFPRGKKLKDLSEEQQTANKGLAQQFDVDAFPTVILLDVNGKKLGENRGYGDDTPAQYIQGLEQMLAKQKKTK